MKQEKQLSDASCQIQMLGNREIYIEGFQSVIEYDENMIVICAKKLQIAFLGTNLLLRALSRERVIITGQIREISFSPKER